MNGKTVLWVPEDRQQKQRRQGELRTGKCPVDFWGGGVKNGMVGGRKERRRLRRSCIIHFAVIIAHGQTCDDETFQSRPHDFWGICESSWWRLTYWETKTQDWQWHVSKEKRNVGQLVSLPNGDRKVIVHFSHSGVASKNNREATKLGFRPKNSLTS